MEKRVMMQAFEWYLPSNQKHFEFLTKNLHILKQSGIDDLWLPPFTKGQSIYDVGYGVYDLFDLGEFDQKGIVATKYGSKAELISLIKRAHELDMNIYADIVLNHKAGADGTEIFEAVLVDENDRNSDCGEPIEIEGWTHFDFPGRKGQYSNFVWNHNHFTGVDYDQRTNTSGIYRIIGENKYWSQNVSHEKGNYDYLMFSNIDHNHPEVKQEIFNWLQWLVKETDIDGLRLDALKHLNSGFVLEMADFVKNSIDKNLYVLGEYWSDDEEEQQSFMDDVQHKIDLFDVHLHYNFRSASLEYERYDLRNIFNNTLIQYNPSMVVTFVDNHDTQLNQALASWVEPWFKPLAYALILLRQEGYPCIFWGDYFGITDDESFDPIQSVIDTMLQVRQQCIFEIQEDYFEDPNVIGWVIRSEDDACRTVAVLINNSPVERSIKMFIGEAAINLSFTEALGYVYKDVAVKEDGFGEFYVQAQSVSVWVASS